MNRYPLWLYALILVTVLIGGYYAAPNIFGSDPAIQVSAASRNANVDSFTLDRVKAFLENRRIEIKHARLEGQRLRIVFKKTDAQVRARELVSRELGKNFTVALTSEPAAPAWLMTASHGPMYLGLDLRGGVHLMLHVDMGDMARDIGQDAAKKTRSLLSKNRIYDAHVREQAAGVVVVNFRKSEDRDKGRSLIGREIRDVTLTERTEGGYFVLVLTPSGDMLRERRQQVIEQNMSALANRVNEYGVAEPIIQQQGEDRIVVQLPGLQNADEAKRLIGRTATLQVKLVDEGGSVSAAMAGNAPPGTRLYRHRNGSMILLKDELVYSGKNIVGASPGFDSEKSTPIVTLMLDAYGDEQNQKVTGKNIGKRMAIIYLETYYEDRLDAAGNVVIGPDGAVVRDKKYIEEVISAPTIMSQLGRRFQIEGLDSAQEANDLSRLLRAGSLAAPVYFIEERTIGPSLGADNVAQGFLSIVIGFVAVMAFMIFYYRGFGVIANVALALNLVLIVAILSILQATLTLPGVAGILLTVGMAVDANVLIFERIREEIGNGITPQAAIHAGYEKAFGTIADANITTLIAAIMLFNFGTGPIKGFAITLSIGILTSMFTAILVTRAIINLRLGGRHLKKLSV